MEIRQLRTISGELDPVFAPSAPIRPLNEAEIGQLLLDVFETWPHSAAYRYALQDLPGDGFPVATWNAPQAGAIRAKGASGEDTQRFNWPGAANANKRAQVQISVPNAPKNALSASLPQVTQICIALDTGPVIPEVLARIVSNGFASGLATRMVVERLSGERCRNLGQTTLPPSVVSDLTSYSKYGATEAAFRARLDVISE